MYTVEFPIRSYLKKMIAYYHETEPLELTVRKNHIAQIIYLCLSRNYRPEKKVPENPKYDSTLRVSIPNHLGREQNFHLCERRVSFIDATLRSIFEEKMCEYILIQHKGKGDIEKYAFQFRELYDISEDELPLTAIKKTFYRYREKNALLDTEKYTLKST